MSQLPVDQGLTRFKQNEERIDKFVNSQDGYITDDGTPVPSLPKFLETAAETTGTVAANLTASLAAKTAAEAARDAAIIGAGMYPDEPTGRAAVADGAYFKVQGSGDIAAYEYRRVNAGTVSTLVATYPSKSAVDTLSTDNEYNKFLTSAPKLRSTRTTSGEIANGAQWYNGTTTVGAGPTSGGWKIPAGSTGNTTYNRYFWSFTAARAAELAGRKVRFLVALRTSANLLSVIPAGNFGKGVAVTGTLGTVENLRMAALSSTKTMLSFDYTFTGNETNVNVYAQVANTVAAASDLILFATSQYHAVLDEFGYDDTLAGLSSTVDAVNQKVNFDQFLLSAPKSTSPRLIEGQSFNGALWYDGATTSGATQYSGGWLIPVGQTGNQTYNRYKWSFTAARAAELAGRKVRFLVALRTSANLLSTVPTMALGTGVTGTAGTFSNTKLAALSPTKALLMFDYVFSGSETGLNVYAQNVNTAVLAAEASMYATGQFMAAWDEFGFADVVEDSLGVYFDDIAQNKLTPVDETPNCEPFTQVFNGASFNTAQKGVDIPAGSSGQNSYITANIPLRRELLRAGETVQLKLVLRTSNNLLAALGNSYGYNINSVSDGVLTTNKMVAGSGLLTQTAIDEITLTGDYVIQSGLDEKVGVYFQTSSALTPDAARFFYLKSVSYLSKTGTESDSVVIRRTSDNSISSGDLKNIVSATGESFLGAAIRDGGLGLTVPAGSTGVSSYRRFSFPVNSVTKFKGSLVRVQMLCRTSVDFTDQTPLTAQLSVYYSGSAPVYNGARSTSVRKLSSRLHLFEFTYILNGTETALAPYFQITGSAQERAGDGFITYDDLRLKFDTDGVTFGTSGTRGGSPADQILAFREALNKVDVTSEISYLKTATVSPDGTKDYTTLAAAITALGAGESHYRRNLFKVYEGVYTETNTTLPNYVDVVGIGQRDKIWFKGELPDSVTPATIPTVQTLWMNYTGRIANIKVTARNMRYPIHSDSGASANRAYQEIDDCYIEHLGNQGARDYQTANGGDPNTVWGSEHAWGCGTHSGQKIFSRRTKWVSKTSPFYFHTNADFAEPCYVELDESASICTTSGGSAIVVQPLGSGQPDRFVVRNSEIDGKMTISPSPWLSTQLYNQRGNQTSEVEIYISGSSPVAWASSNNCNVLELRSLDSASSSVLVSGTGATALFGVVPSYVSGGSGFPARVYSSHAVTGSVAGVSLGARLGDCSSVNKTLNIVFDGTVNRTLVLNQNYTTMTNAQVVTALNGLLSDATRGFYELDPYDNDAPVFQPEREVTLQNNSSIVITKGSAVAFDGSRRLCRLATSSDARTMIVGVVLETIAPGKFGRILKSGQLYVSAIRFNGSSSASFGDVFGVGSVAGAVQGAAAVPLLRCVESSIFEIIE